MDKFKKNREKQWENFRDIALGKAELETQKDAQMLFKDSFDQFNEVCISKLRDSITAHLTKPEIRNAFDREFVYNHLDEKYIRDSNEVTNLEQIVYFDNPVEKFEEYME